MGKFGTLTSCKILNPWIDCHKICHSWLRPRGERFSEARAEIKPKIIESSIIFDQTLWPILTHDGSKCAESRKYVPFGVTIFNFNIWPLFTPKNVKFCLQNSNFKPIWWNMKVQVYQKLLNQWTWKSDTMLRTWNSVLRCNMMTSQQIQYGGRPPYWKSSFGYISAIYCPN